jgi:hypothetical protein
VAQLDVGEFLKRFRDRADAVRERGIPPLEGEARRTFVESMELDYLDYSLVGSATWAVEEGHLVLRIPLS